MGERLEQRLYCKYIYVAVMSKVAVNECVCERVFIGICLCVIVRCMCKVCVRERGDQEMLSRAREICLSNGQRKHIFLLFVVRSMLTIHLKIMHFIDFKLVIIGN